MKNYCFETCFVKRLFLYLCALVAKPLILGKVGGHDAERDLKELSNYAVFRVAVPLLVLELCADFIEKKKML